MRGVIQYINSVQHSGVVLGQDGKQYGFTLFDCVPGNPPRMGEIVTFQVQNGAAVEVGGAATPTERRSAVPDNHENQSAAGFDFHALRQSISEATYGAFDARHEGPRMARSDGGSRAMPLPALFNDWRNLLAAAALIASLLPFFSYAAVSANLFGTASLAQAGIDSLKSVQTLTAQFAPPPAAMMGHAMPENTALLEQQAAISKMIWGLRLSYLLYIIPALACASLFAAFRGRTNVRPAFWLGVSCASLPVFAEGGDYLMALYKGQAIFGAMLPNVWGVLGLGFYVLCAVGVALVLVHLRMIGAVPPKAYVSKYA